MLFLKGLIVNPRATGAILPSSKRLAKTMASFVKLEDDSLVIELGPGTGVITQALLDAGVPPSQMVLIECAPYLVRALKKKFPNIEVIEGNAAHLTALLANKKQKVSSIVSSLPLRSLPVNMAKAILDQIPKTLINKGRYIQFTYDFRKKNNFLPNQYYLEKSKTILCNVPPAKAQTFKLINEK